MLLAKRQGPKRQTCAGQLSLKCCFILGNFMTRRLDNAGVFVFPQQQSLGVFTHSKDFGADQVLEQVPSGASSGAGCRSKFRSRFLSRFRSKFRFWSRLWRTFSSRFRAGFGESLQVPKGRDISQAPERLADMMRCCCANVVTA